MKRNQFLITVLTLAIGIQIQFVRANADYSLETKKLHQRLSQINAGWLERTPDFSILREAPSTNSEIDLIQTHLKLVVEQLNRADNSHLSAAQRQQRMIHIQELERYLRAGIFPKNVFVSGYRPVFIDPWGTHCAVGHLIARSGAGDLAATINEEHQLDFLGDIQTSGLEEWQVASGLSFEELALIQPTYHSRGLSYPEAIEELILGDSITIRKAIEADPTLVTARCGGKTLLHFAAAAGDLELVKLLVQKGADIHTVSTFRSPVKLDSEEKVSGDSKPEKPSHIFPRSSSTLYTVRWNEPTLMTPNRTGGIRMGVFGRVFSSKASANITNKLGDLSGGVADKNAIYFATEIRRMTYAGKELKAHVETDPGLIQLSEGRAEVVAWLNAQGLK